MRSSRTRAVTTLIAITALAVSACTGVAKTSSPASQTSSPTSTPSPTIAAPTATPSPIPSVGTWSATGSMVTAHGPESTATLLADGKVLVVGGGTDVGGTAVDLTATAELYDPSTGKWTKTGEMTMSRAQHTATLLQDGRVLVAGGFCSKRCPPYLDPDLDPSGAIATAEIYDPRTGTWSATGSMTTPRAVHTATLLADGKVLVAGAEHADDNFGYPEPFARGILASTELYDPSTGKWTATGSMVTARTAQVAALLTDGKVLVVGGIGPLSPTEHGLLASAELYDPATGKWTATGGLTTARAYYGSPATILKDGRVLLTGGDGPGDPTLASAELYDPRSGTWTPTGSMITARDGFTTTLLADGKVLVTAGIGVYGELILTSAEIYDPSSGTWTAAASLITARWGHTATLLHDGRVLVTSGTNDDSGPSSSAELYDEAGT